MTKTVFYPLGPQTDEPDAAVCILICQPDQKVMPVWGATWDSALKDAEDMAGDRDWITVPWLADLSDVAAGRGATIRAADVMPLGRALGQHMDPNGFGPDVTDEMGFAVMQTMALFSGAMPLIPDGTAQPVHLDLYYGEKGERFFGAYERSGAIVSVFLTVSEEHLRRLFETAFTQDGAPGVPYLFARVIPDHDTTGQAVQALFGAAFRPMIRSVNGQGDMFPCETFDAKVLSLAMARAPEIAAGAEHVTGMVSFLSSQQEAEMRRVSL